MSNKELVKQDYRLVNARYKLHTNEQKLILYGISSVNENDPDDMVYSVKVSELGDELANVSLKNKHTRLKEFCESLLQKPVFIPDDSGGFLIANWFSSLRYIQGEGVLKYRISTDLKPYLVDLKKRFVQYNLQNILQLSSTYSIRLYQLLKEYEKIGRRDFNLVDLQTMLDVPQSMILYSNFKLKVLTIALREINEYTDIRFKYEEIKTGRKITSLRFIILPPDEKADVSIENSKRINTFLALVAPEYRKDAKKVLHRFLHLSDSVIVSNIRLTSSEKRESFPAFLTAALKSDYAENSRSMIQQLENDNEQYKLASEYEINARNCFTGRSNNGTDCYKICLNAPINIYDKTCFWCAEHLLPDVVDKELLDKLVSREP